MTKRGARRAALLLVVAAALPGVAWPTAARAEAPQEALRDEFGLVPAEPADRDLALPDPMLDRTWPGPKPGDGQGRPARVAVDEEAIDPFVRDPELDEAPPPPPANAPPAAAALPLAPPAPRPAVAGSVARPGAGPGAGSPAPAAAPALPVAEREDLARELEQEEAPSPLEQDDEGFERESGDPGEW